MTHDPDPTPELNTTRIGGGRKAWVIALAALVVLAVFVYLGVSGPVVPQSRPDPRPSSAVAAASPTPVPTLNLNEVTSIRADPTAPLPYQYLGTGLTLNGHGTLAILDPVGPDEYVGTYRIPYSKLGPIARIELDAVTASVSHDDLDRLGDWAFPLNVAHGDDAPMTVFSAGGDATDQTLTTSEFQRLASDGYQLDVKVAAQEDAALMTIDVVVRPQMTLSDEKYTVMAGPPGDQFEVPLEQYAAGGFEGQAKISADLYGTSLPVSLAVADSFDPSDAATSVGAWTIDVPARPNNSNLTQIQSGAPGTSISAGEPQILANGYIFGIGQKLIGGDLYVVVSLSVTTGDTSASGPVPTR